MPAARNKVKTMNMRDISDIEHQQQSQHVRNNRFPVAESVLVLITQVQLYMNVMSGHTSHQSIAQFIPLFYSTCVS